jgi:hypothetical protein
VRVFIVSFWEFLCYVPELKDNQHTLDVVGQPIILQLKKLIPPLYFILFYKNPVQNSYYSSNIHFIFHNLNFASHAKNLLYIL